MLQIRHTGLQVEIPLKYIFVAYYLVLVVVLLVLLHYNYTTNIVLIGIVASVSGIAMYFVIRIICYLNSKPLITAHNILIFIGYLMSFAVLGGLAFIWFYRDFSLSPHSEIDKTIEQINQRLTRLNVATCPPIFREPNRSSIFSPFEQMRLSLLTPELTEQPKSHFVITIIRNNSVSEYLFKVSEYTLETGGLRPDDPRTRLCEFIDKAYDEKIPVLEAFREYPIGISYQKGPIGIDANTGLIVELIYVIRKFYKMRNSRVEVLAKGYADGQMNRWERPLDRYYPFRQIAIYPKLNPNSKNPFEYIHSPIIYSVPENYTNKHLPNLRAKFIIEDFVRPFLPPCNMSQNLVTHVLDGYEFAEMDPQKRVAQIYIVLF